MGARRGREEGREREREARRALSLSLSCSCSLPKRVNRKTRHRRPAPRASLREASPQRPPEETQGQVLCILGQAAGAKPRKGLWRAKGEWALLPAAGRRCRRRRRVEIALSLFLFVSLPKSTTYAFLRPPFPRLDTRLFFPTAMVEIKAVKRKEVLKRGGGKL